VGRKPDAKSSGVHPTPRHVVLAVVFRARAGELQVLLWQRAVPPFAGAWALPGGILGANETLEVSVSRHLAAKVDVRDVTHLEQLRTLSDPERSPGEREVATAYLGLVPRDADPALPADTAWHGIDSLPPLAYDHAAIVGAARERLRAKLSYTNIAFALAPERFTISELREIYAAALGRDVSPTNLQRVLLRRDVIEPTGARRAPGPSGGRPGALFRFRARHLQITDEFAVLRPRGPIATGAP